MKKEALIWIVVIAGLAAFIGWRALRPPAPTPAVFQDGAGSLTLTEALSRSEAEGKPVFAVATADWCPPCQALKRGALADQRVASYINQGMIPVYIDVDQRPGEAQQLGVSSIPASFVIRDGQVAARTVGSHSPDDYLKWLRDAGG